MESSDGSTRRGFYSAFIYGLGSLMSAALALPALAYLLVKPKSANKTAWVDATDVASLQTGKPEEVMFQQTRVDGWRVSNEKSTAWVVKLDPQQIVAYSPQCTHLACAYHWDNQTDKFVCPCHGSEFSIDGKVLAGPAPRPLDRYPTRIANGKLMISPVVENS